MANNLHVPLAGWTVPRPTFRRVKVTVPASTQVITLSSLKSHLRITHSSDDDYLNELIATAVGAIENYTSRSLLNRTQQQWMDFLPGTGNEYTLYGAGTAQVPVRYATLGMFRWFDLMSAPVLSVTKMQFVDNTNTEQTFDASNYIVDAADPDAPARIILQRGCIWPVDLRVARALYVEYVVGYGSIASDVPAPIRHAVRLMAAALWSNRGDDADKANDVLGFTSVRSILDPYRIPRISTL